MQLIRWREQKLSSILTICMVLLVVLVCVRLGFWQLERGEQKQQQLVAIAQLQTHGVMSWQQVEALPSSWNKTGLLVQLTGQFLPKHYWLLDNKIYNGQVGYDLLALFKPQQHSAALLVNLGWLKAPMSRNTLPQVTLPSGPYTLQAQIKENNLSGFSLADSTRQVDLAKRIQTIDLKQLSAQSQQPLQGFMAYRQGTGDELGVPHYQAVVMSPQKHNAYALQWFLIALACIVVAVFASKKRTQDES
ncbi:SURF1 family protein [Pseudoalteromonas sp.]|uniref:SURF1 family protein n=1 Tax=Pseudoalteromonas sp. TaxID=53249 RepID=UPI003561C0AE